MPSYPVLQPNGKLAVWSTVPDDFVFVEGTREQVVRYLCRRFESTPQAYIEMLVDAVIKGIGGVRPDWWYTWKECVQWKAGLASRHGWEGTSVTREWLFEVTPEEKRPELEAWMAAAVENWRADEERDRLREMEEDAAHE